MNAQLQITRSFHFVGWARAARITMDGADIANIGTGKTVTLEVPPGKHVLSAWIGNNPSAQNTIEFVPGETVHLECKLKMGLFSNSFELTSNEGRLISGESAVAGHHGRLILVLGILGFLFGILGLAALVQGIADLTKMSRGKMDRSGELLTWIGLILGTIGFLINVMLIVILLASGGHP
jgi:hypothetical protein